jgi:DNA polymerase elongation subunit (family B)
MTVKEGFEFGKRLGYELSTRCFGSPMELEFEKLYAPYILFDKQKKYCGHKFEKSLTDYDVEHKGTPDVKRDYPRYFQTIYHDLMSYIEDHATTYTNQSVFECLRPFIDRLSNNECTVDELQTSSSLNNDITNATAVSKAWERMKQRQDPDTPQSGDRLAYAHVYSPSKYNRKRKSTLKTRDYTESVSHIRRHNVPLDANYYLDKLATTLNDVMKCVDPDNSHANVRIDTTDEHYTFRNAVLEYIERGKRRFQDVMEAKYIQPTNAKTTKRDVLENEQGESLIDQIEQLF